MRATRTRRSSWLVRVGAPVIVSGIALATMFYGAVRPDVVAAADGTASSDGTASITPGALVIDTIDGVTPDPAQTRRTAALLGEAVAAAAETEPVGVSSEVASDPSDFDQAVRICFGSPTPEAVQVLAKAAVEAWATELGSGGPTIEIDLYWLDFGSPQSLGAAGPGSFVQDERLPDPGSRYPVALANQLLGVDFSPRDPCDLSRDPDVLVLLNQSAGGDGQVWNIGEGAPSPTQIDLQSVILHELGHGWGFISSAELGIAASGASEVQWPLGDQVPFVYDRMMLLCEQETASGCAVQSPVAVGEVGALTSGRLWFDLPGREAVELYAPSLWDRGSSVAHLDQERYGLSQPLLTPFLGLGESERVIDNAALAVLQRLGYPLRRPPADVRSVELSTGDGSVALLVAVGDLSLGPPPAYFDVELSSSTGVSSLHRVDPDRPQLTGLTNGQTFGVRVRAGNAAAEGLWVDAPELVTPLALPPFATAERFLSVVERIVGPELVFDDSPGINADLLLARARIVGSVDVLAELFESEPAQHQQVIVRLYRGLLHRQPDQGGFDFWRSQAQRGVEDPIIARSFAVSLEFAQGRQLDDAEFVDALYAQVLRRDADPNGRSFWTSQLRAGLDRGHLVLALTESVEYRRSIDQVAFNDLLGYTVLDRFPTELEISAWSDAARFGNRPAAVRLALEILTGR